MTATKPRKIPALAGLPIRRTMRRNEAEAFLGGEQILKDALRAGTIRPRLTGSQVYFATSDIIAVETDILAGRYPGKGGSK